MKLLRNYPFVNMPEDLPDEDFDIYSENFDDETAIDTGMKPNEAAFLRGFKRSN